MADLESTSLSRPQHASIKVNALCLNAMVSKQFQPLSATATQVQTECSRMRLDDGQDKRQVDLQSLLDVLSAASVRIFKGAVKIIAHGSIFNRGLSQAMPTNSS